ncbi:WD40 repeat-like protein [Phellopilus nigrolimitatus]|nr:WD40 repeat-like protein [Phellopilus nigrolimitatus]
MNMEINPWADFVLESDSKREADESQPSTSNIPQLAPPRTSVENSSLNTSYSPKTHESRSSMHRLLHDRTESPLLSAATYAFQRKALKRAFRGTLDRVNVLGDDDAYGHTGCVNALSWALNGDVLISGGDDRTLRLWRLDPSDTSTPYPYKQSSVIHTGHTANIFNAQVLPWSSRIASVAGDREVRVFDVERALTTVGQGPELHFSERDTCIRVLKCHSGRTKRIVTEESSDTFLTVAEDGAVRQHDLRTPHRCTRTRGICPPPLVQLPHDLSTLALSPLAPYTFVVAGESPHGYLFDRRQVGRTLQGEWGVPCTDENYVTCVRRFGRTQRVSRRGEHITGARMAQTNGHEVLLSYSADAVYLYSVLDQPCEFAARRASILPPNPKKRKLSPKEPTLDLGLSDEDSTTPSTSSSEGSQLNAEGLQTSDDFVDPQLHEGSDDESEEDEEDEESGVPFPELDEKFKSPTILPRRRFDGHCNIETVKDVNFIGVEDEFVASGSDDGNFFLWEKNSGRLHGIYEGDGSVVNVIENHPRLPLVACSGIDTTVKLFAPTEKQSSFSRMRNADAIIKRNSSDSTARRSVMQFGFASLLTRYGMALRQEGDDESEDGASQCTPQ